MTLESYYRRMAEAAAQRDAAIARAEEEYDERMAAIEAEMDAEESAVDDRRNP